MIRKQQKYQNTKSYICPSHRDNPLGRVMIGGKRKGQNLAVFVSLDEMIVPHRQRLENRLARCNYAFQNSDGFFVPESRVLEHLGEAVPEQKQTFHPLSLAHNPRELQEDQ